MPTVAHLNTPRHEQVAQRRIPQYNQLDKALARTAPMPKFLYKHAKRVRRLEEQDVVRRHQTVNLFSHTGPTAGTKRPRRRKRGKREPLMTVAKLTPIQTLHKQQERQQRKVLMAARKKAIEERAAKKAAYEKAEKVKRLAEIIKTKEEVEEARRQKGGSTGRTSDSPRRRSSVATRGRRASILLAASGNPAPSPTSSSPTSTSPSFTTSGRRGSVARRRSSVVSISGGDSATGGSSRRRSSVMGRRGSEASSTAGRVAGGGRRGGVIDTGRLVVFAGGRRQSIGELQARLDLFSAAGQETPASLADVAGREIGDGMGNQGRRRSLTEFHDQGKTVFRDNGKVAAPPPAADTPVNGRRGSVASIAGAGSSPDPRQRRGSAASLAFSVARRGSAASIAMAVARRASVSSTAAPRRGSAVSIASVAAAAATTRRRGSVASAAGATPSPSPHTESVAGATVAAARGRRRSSVGSVIAAISQARRASVASAALAAELSPIMRRGSNPAASPVTARSGVTTKSASTRATGVASKLTALQRAKAKELPAAPQGRVSCPDPQRELQAGKACLKREGYLERLRHLADLSRRKRVHPNEVMNVLGYLRRASLEAVEAVQHWRKGLVRRRVWVQRCVSAARSAHLPPLAPRFPSASAACRSSGEGSTTC